MPLDIAMSVLHAHTTPDMLGRLFAICQPHLGVGYHYFVNDDTIDPFFEGLKSTYDGPVALAQDLMVINITPDQIVTRMGETDLLHWTPKPHVRPARRPISNRRLPPSSPTTSPTRDCPRPDFSTAARSGQEPFGGAGRVVDEAQPIPMLPPVGQSLCTRLTSHLSTKRCGQRSPKFRFDVTKELRVRVRSPQVRQHQVPKLSSPYIGRETAAEYGTNPDSGTNMTFCERR